MVNLHNLYETIRPALSSILTNQPFFCGRISTFVGHFSVVVVGLFFVNCFMVIVTGQLLSYHFSMTVIDQLPTTIFFFLWLSTFDFQGPLSSTSNYQFTVTDLIVFDHLKPTSSMIIVKLLSKSPHKNYLSLYINILLYYKSNKFLSRNTFEKEVVKHSRIFLSRSF